MKNFENAQRLFKDYQEIGDLNKLRASLDLLDEIIEGQNIDYQRASNFREIILEFIRNRKSDILIRCNIVDFLKDVTVDEFRDILSASATKETIKEFSELRKIESDYFKEKEN